MTSTFNTLVSQESINQTVQALLANGFQPEVVENKSDALERIKELIPKGASIHNGGSTTLQEIGYIDYLKSNTHGWNNLHANILDESDPEKQSILRRESAFSDYYLGSVHALSETGEMVIASNTGSQLPHLVFTSPNIIFVVGTQKITPTLEKAIRRLEEYVVPLEDDRAMNAYKMHTMNTKTLIMHKENPMMGRNVKVILVKESLGF
ncbi:MAG: LUD domain-containing protein [Candidatus Pacebacteria bacterium]|jgi:L-lactate utilization protein LutB|nr:LUD domain-containing protein [Candidatus Paceibacterota bacterium]